MGLGPAAAGSPELLCSHWLQGLTLQPHRERNPMLTPPDHWPLTSPLSKRCLSPGTFFPASVCLPAFTYPCYLSSLDTYVKHLEQQTDIGRRQPVVSGCTHLQSQDSGNNQWASLGYTVSCQLARTIECLKPKQSKIREGNGWLSWTKG